jgi:hypothetical protein
MLYLRKDGPRSLEQGPLIIHLPAAMYQLARHWTLPTRDPLPWYQEGTLLAELKTDPVIPD